MGSLRFDALQIPVLEAQVHSHTVLRVVYILVAPVDEGTLVVAVGTPVVAEGNQAVAEGNLVVVRCSPVVAASDSSGRKDS